MVAFLRGVEEMLSRYENDRLNEREAQIRCKRKYGVLIQWYSLAQNEVGKPLGSDLVSAHRSLRAAGRVLGSLISGKRRKHHPADGRGGQYYVFDFDTGERWTRNQCPR